MKFPLGLDRGEILPAFLLVPFENGRFNERGICTIFAGKLRVGGGGGGRRGVCESVATRKILRSEICVIPFVTRLRLSCLGGFSLVHINPNHIAPPSLPYALVVKREGGEA